VTGSSNEIEYRELPGDDPQVRQPDISKAKRVLDWEPKTNRKDGLEKTMKYFKKQVLKNG